jgi:hypothetical protein
MPVVSGLLSARHCLARVAADDHDLHPGDDELQERVRALTC